MSDRVVSLPFPTSRVFGSLVLAAVLTASITASTGCGGGGGDGGDDMMPSPGPEPTAPPAPTAPPPEPTPSGPQAVEIRFAAEMGGEPFECGQLYGPVGTEGSEVEPSDLRFYVHDIRLFETSGGEVPVELDQDGEWQLENLALIDFENGEGLCGNVGDAATNTVVRGTVPAGEYRGIRLVLGVPFEWNHGDAATAPSPLNRTALFWNWNVGYKYLRFDNYVTEAESEFRMHLGSTACDGDLRGNVTECGNPNRVEIELFDFDPAVDAVTGDFLDLFAATNVEENTPETAPGCQAAPNDPECVGPFDMLGLPFGMSSGRSQRIFFAAPAPDGPVGPTPTPGAPQPPAEFSFNLPEGFPEPLVPADNPMSVIKVQLGRRLFYDTRLSLNETASCSSCHEQARAFTDGRAVAVGSTGEETPRNSPSLTNVVYNPTLTWMNPLLVDLEDQALVPIFGEDPVELGFAGREDVLFERFRGDAEYAQMFADAFPEEAEPVSISTITKALSAFQRTMISGRSPYDRWLRGDDSAISEAALRGMNLFFSELLECDHCHGGLNFASSLTHSGNPNDPTPFENNGLYNIDGNGGYPEPNVGLFEFTQDPRDIGRMKPPTLRNIELTAPYMHDGSMETLEEVIEHYARGGRFIGEGPNAGDGALSPTRSDLVTGFPISDDGIADMVEFLKTLTDEEFVNDPSLSDPFAE